MLCYRTVRDLRYWHHRAVCTCNPNVKKPSQLHVVINIRSQDSLATRHRASILKPRLFGIALSPVAKTHFVVYRFVNIIPVALPCKGPCTKHVRGRGVGGGRQKEHERARRGGGGPRKKHVLQSLPLMTM